MTVSKDSNETSLRLVDTKSKSLDDYRSAAEESLIDEIRELSQDLKGLRLLQINSTSSGGGVAELLNSLVPLEADCGINAEWRLLCPDEQLFRVTKGFHNALQGQQAELPDSDKEVYRAQNRHCAAMLAPDEYDVVIVHDPQPAAMPSFTSRNGVSWVWRCHIDSSLPDPTVWEFVNGYVSAYDAAVFTMDEFVPPGLTGPRMYTIPPAIDPLSSKNRTLPKYLSRGVVEEFGTDLSRPMILQVSRFDPWKDPVGVIQAYRLVKENLPELQLVLIGSMASDDPEGWAVLDAAKNEAGGDPDIKLFTNLNGVGAHEVNAFQRTADVVVQKSVREGFGLVVSEAVWKGTPVVGGATGGIPLQIQDEVGGYLVNSVEECAEKVGYLLENPEESSSVAERGRELVRHNFLILRLLRDELRLLRDLKNGPPNSTSLSP